MLTTQPTISDPSDASFASRSVRLFSSSIIDQVVLSGTNFLVGVLMIRLASDQDYGLYVLIQSGLLLAVSVHNAWLCGPLAILTPRMAAEARWQTIVSVLHVQRHWIRIVAAALLAIVALACAVGLLSATLASVIAAAIVVGWTVLRREFLRSVLLMYTRPHVLLGVDSVYAATFISVVIIAAMIGKHLLFGALGALALAAWMGAASASRSFNVDPGWRTPGKVSIWPDIAKLGFWSVMGSSIYWFLGQSYSYVLASRLDLSAVANVNAVRLLLMPAFVITIGISALLTPTAATWYAQMGIHKLVSRLLLFILAIGIIEGVYFGIIWMIRHWLLVEALHKHIEDADRLLILWAGVAVTALFRDTLQCGLIAMGKLQSLAWLVGLSAIVSLGVAWFGITWWGAPAVLIGQIAGETVNLAGIVYLLRKNMKHAAE